jgi:hypothetical protein
LAEARLQTSDDFRFEAPPGNGCFLSQPMMKLLRQANADHPTPRALYQGKTSANRSKGKANNQSGNGGNGDGHGDQPSAISILFAWFKRSTDNPRRSTATAGATRSTMPSTDRA